MLRQNVASIEHVRLDRILVGRAGKILVVILPDSGERGARSILSEGLINAKGSAV